MVSLNPTSVNIQPSSWAIFWQSIRRISCNSLYWHSLDHRAFFQMERSYGDLFDENHARAIGLHPGRLKILFSPCCRFRPLRRCKRLVPFWYLSGGDSRCNSMVVNRSFSPLLIIAVTIGSVTSFLGAWVSTFWTARQVESSWWRRHCCFFSICICAHPWAFGKSSACA